MSYTYDYPRAALTVDAVVFRPCGQSYELLLIRRAHYPFEGMWALPGGFINMDETLEQAVVRELEEETGLRAEGLQQLHAFSDVNRDPRGRTVTVTFYGVVSREGSQVKGGDDAAEAKWFDTDHLPELAFDHIQAVEMALRKIR
ncbi:MAG: NUDIX hydrolase [Bacteroidales bacterium]|nr:NUDIX hydrolase [Bacteroidales bacterium]